MIVKELLRGAENTYLNFVFKGVFKLHRLSNFIYHFTIQGIVLGYVFNWMYQINTLPIKQSLFFFFFGTKKNYAASFYFFLNQKNQVKKFPFQKQTLPTVAQEVKNPTAASWVTVEAQFQSPGWHSGLKDPALLQPWLVFNPLAQELPYTMDAAIKFF